MAESKEPSNIHCSEKPMTKPRTTISWGPKSPKALVYDPLKPGEVTEEDASEDNKATNSFEVQLPRWRNRVHVYEDQEKLLGYIFTLRLDRLGFVKNCKRRLGYDYKVLHVKGERPG